MKLMTSLIAIIFTIIIVAGESRAEQQTVCAGSVPAGWIRIDDRWEPTKCGNPVAISANVWTIERYDNKPVGSVMNACTGTVPRGWSIIGQKWDATKCGKPAMYTENIMTIKRLNEPPARAASEGPRGIVFVAPASNFATRVKAGKQVLASPEGQQYESSWGEIMQTILTTCVPPESSNPSNLGRFTFAADVSASGVVSSVEIEPSTEISQCFADAFGKVHLPSPPAALINGQKITVADDIVITQ